MPHVTTSEMSWIWIAQAVILPATVAVLVALPFWRWGTPLTGTIIGAGGIFVFAVAFVGREYIALERFHQHCLELIQINVVCHQPYPEAFTRFCIYLFIAMIEAFGLFTIGAAIEAARQRRAYAVEWRRTRR